MKKLVLDASVTMKWLLPAAEQEEDLDAALNILRGVKASELEVCQPAHWLAETAAVAALHLTDALLITADRKYYHKAASFGGIALLKDF